MLKHANTNNSNSEESDNFKDINLFHLKPHVEDDFDDTEIGPHLMANNYAFDGSDLSAAIDPNIVRKYNTVCMLCGIDFKCRAYLHAHLCRHKHFIGQLDATTHMPKYECRTCENVINCVTMIKHRCFIKQVAEIKARQLSLDRCGSPLLCTLCRGRLLPSRVHLVIHLIVAHSRRQDPYSCVFCQAKFESENLLMQEIHAFDWHAPVLFILNRKASFKMIRNLRGNILDSCVPFTCFYDPSKLESAQLTSFFKRTKVQSSEQNEKAKKEKADKEIPKEVKICSMNFSSLVEFTAHIHYFHGALSTGENKSGQNQMHDAVDEVKRAQKSRFHVPGPTVTALLKSQLMHLNSSGNDTMSKPINDAPKNNDNVSKIPEGMTNQCRVCFEYFLNENKLIQHIESHHLPECKKRLMHLAKKNKLSGVLDINKLCTECYILFPDIISLQVHMMVSHSSKDWRHCGLCNVEFFSETGSTPSHLNLVLYKTDKSKLSVLDCDNSSTTWPLPSELMWRIITTHEMVHVKSLFPKRQVPFMPSQLIDQLIDGNAIQAAMAARWILKKLKEETEGPLADDEPIPGVKGPATTQEAFGIGQNKVRYSSIDKHMVDAAALMLAEMMKKEGLDVNKVTVKSKGRSNRLSLCSTNGQINLPSALAKHFSAIGKSNANRQMEHEFANCL